MTPKGLVTDLHAVNSSLEQGGFGPQLLCTLVGFRDPAGRRVGLVYLYKRGTFYPFAPLGGERRDSALEMQVRGALGDDLKVEPDLGRWFPVWGVPGCDRRRRPVARLTCGPVPAAVLAECQPGRDREWRRRAYR